MISSAGPWRSPRSSTRSAGPPGRVDRRGRRDGQVAARPRSGAGCACPATPCSWCDLAASTSPDAVPATLLARSRRPPVDRPVGGRERRRSPGRPTCVGRAGQLRARHRRGPALVGAIRAGCADVRISGDESRSARMRGEHVVSLSTLPSDDAIGLFCTRASEARTDLMFDEPTLAAIDEICTRLDRIPLAIELAAARCRSMAPAEIAARLDHRFRLLRGGRGVPSGTGRSKRRSNGPTRCSKTTSVTSSIGWRSSQVVA